jgi:general secretion pathway protein H
MAAPSPRLRGAGQGEGQGRRSKGFTLIELLVVMVIIALLMTGVPRLIAGLPGVRLRAAADDMADRLKGLHSEARRRGATMALTVDPAARTYRISTDTAPHRLPEVVDRVDVKSPGVFPSDGTAQIRFFADGTATAGMVRLRHGQRSAAITVDWLTGRVRRDE